MFLVHFVTRYVDLFSDFLLQFSGKNLYRHKYEERFWIFVAQSFMKEVYEGFFQSRLWWTQKDEWNTCKVKIQTLIEKSKTDYYEGFFFDSLNTPLRRSWLWSAKRRRSSSGT